MERLEKAMVITENGFVAWGREVLKSEVLRTLNTLASPLGPSLCLSPSAVSEGSRALT